MNRLNALFSALVVVASLLVPIVLPMTARAGVTDGRDPFRPFLPAAPVLATTSLQRFSVDEMHVEGIISGIASPHALVRTPDGTTTEVQVGTHLGLRGGKIAHIAVDAIVVVEPLGDENGVRNEREVILGLSPDHE